MIFKKITPSFLETILSTLHLGTYSVCSGANGRGIYKKYCFPSPADLWLRIILYEDGTCVCEYEALPLVYYPGQPQSKSILKKRSKLIKLLSRINPPDLRKKCL